MKKLNLLGQKFGRLIVLSEAPSRGRHYYWACACECGRQTTVCTTHLRSGKIDNCSCKKSERISVKIRTHGQSHSPEFNSWASMWDRCTNKNNKSYSRYGSRGISVCERWDSFENFLADLGKRPSIKHSLNRLKNDGNYEPGNCTWSTKKEQANNRRSSLYLVFGGSKKTASEWADSLGMSYQTLQSRLQRGWPIDRALTQPIRECR